MQQIEFELRPKAFPERAVPETTIPDEQRGLIGPFQKSYLLVRDVLIAEFLVECWLGRWRRIDSAVSFLAALTAGSSAVAGWALWNQEEWRLAWVGLAGIATLMSLALTHFGIPKKIREVDSLWKRFYEVHVEGQGLLDQIDLKQIEEKEAVKRYLQIQRRFGEVKRDFEPGFLRGSEKKRKSAEKVVDEQLKNYQADVND